MAKKYIALATAEGLLPKDNMHINKLFVATKAFIEYEGKILILQESGKYVDGTNVGRYDVPGGRVEPGQRFDESLRREIKEETGLEDVELVVVLPKKVSWTAKDIKYI